MPRSRDVQNRPRGCPHVRRDGVVPLEATFADEFLDMWTCKQAEELTSPPQPTTEEDRHIQRRLERRLLIAEADEHSMEAWHDRFLQDITA